MLAQRLLVAAIGIPVLLLILVAGNPWLPLLLVVLVTAAAVETANLLSKAGFSVHPIVGGALALLIALAAASDPVRSEPAAGRGGDCGGGVDRLRPGARRSCGSSAPPCRHDPDERDRAGAQHHDPDRTGLRRFRHSRPAGELARPRPGDAAHRRADRLGMRYGRLRDGPAVPARPLLRPHIAQQDLVRCNWWLCRGHVGRLPAWTAGYPGADQGPVDRAGRLGFLRPSAT